MRYEEIIKMWQKEDVKTGYDLERVLNNYGVNFAYHSAKIENDNIDYNDTREVFQNGRVSNYTGDLRTLFEIQNSKNAYQFMLNAFGDRQPIDSNFVKKLQRILTVGTYDESRYLYGERPGSYKLHDYVTGRNEVGALPEDVPIEMEELLEEIQNVEAKDVLTAAAYLHAKFENIHPFADGNGRTGRLLMNYFLLINNHPPIIIHEESRKDYYSALEKFDEFLELLPLKEYLTQQLSLTWEKRLSRLNIREKLKAAQNKRTSEFEQLNPNKKHIQ